MEKLTDVISSRLESIKTSHLLCFVVISVEIITAIMNSIMGVIWLGHFSHELILVGTIDAFVGVIVVAPIAISINEKVVRLKTLNEVLSESIESSKRVENELRASQEELRKLSSHLQSVREEERSRIAREIHDELGQALTAIKMDVAWLKKRLDGKDAVLSEKAAATMKIIDGTIQSVKRIATELRPGVLDHLGLAAAVEWAVREFENRTGIKCSMLLEPEEFEIDKRLSTDIFRILQESLTNVMRHASATKVDVSLKAYDDVLELVIKDNGRGITKEKISDPSSFGLLGIKERVNFWNGVFDICCPEQGGTEIRVRVPTRQLENKVL